MGLSTYFLGYFLFDSIFIIFYLNIFFTPLPYVLSVKENGNAKKLKKKAPLLVFHVFVIYFLKYCLIFT